MRILFLTQIIPYPPDAGPRVKTWHVLRYLSAQGHEVTLVSFVRPEEEQYVPVLRELCAAVHTVPIRRSRLADVGYWLRSHLSGRPFLIERDDLSAMRRLLAGLAAQERFDAVHADQLGMGQFALPFKNGASDSPVWFSMPTTPCGRLSSACASTRPGCCVFRQPSKPGA